MTKFLVDRMLGQTAKWLRFLGIDAEYAPECEDEKLLEIAKEEQRIIITRDKELGRYDDVFLVEKGTPENIIKNILDTYHVEIEPLSRCAKCNTSVESIPEEEVKEEIPEGIYQRNEKFWYCSGCDQYYWRGSHWDKIMKKIEDIVEDSDEG